MSYMVTWVAVHGGKGDLTCGIVRKSTIGEISRDFARFGEIWRDLPRFGETVIAENLAWISPNLACTACGLSPSGSAWSSGFIFRLKS